MPMTFNPNTICGVHVFSASRSDINTYVDDTSLFFLLFSFAVGV